MMIMMMIIISYIDYVQPLLSLGTEFLYLIIRKTLILLILSPSS